MMTKITESVIAPRFSVSPIQQSSVIRHLGSLAAKEKLKINGMKYPVDKVKGNERKYKEL